jgi:hypothetical protein
VLMGIATTRQPEQQVGSGGCASVRPNNTQGVCSDPGTFKFSTSSLPTIAFVSGYSISRLARTEELDPSCVPFYAIQKELTPKQSRHNTFCKLSDVFANCADAVPSVDHVLGTKRARPTQRTCTLSSSRVWACVQSGLRALA